MYTDKDLAVRNSEQADIVDHRITEMTQRIVLLTGPKNKKEVGYLLRQLSWAHMELDRFELLEESEGKDERI